MNATKIASVLLILGVFGSVVNASGVYFTINGPGTAKFEDSSGNVYLTSSRRNIFYRDNATKTVSVFWDGAAFLGEAHQSPQVNALHVSGGGDFYFSISQNLAYNSSNYKRADLIHYSAAANSYTKVWEVNPSNAKTGGQGWDLNALYLPNNDLSKIIFSIGNTVTGNPKAYDPADLLQWTPPDTTYQVLIDDARNTIGGPGNIDAILSYNGLVLGGGNWPGGFENTNLYLYSGGGTAWEEAVDLLSSFHAGPSQIISVHGEIEVHPVPEPLTVLSLLLCVSGIAIYVLRQHEEDLTLL